MDVRWWTETPSGTKPVKVDAYADQENHLVTSSDVQNNRSTRRPPLGELFDNQLNIQRSKTPRLSEVNKVHAKTSSRKDQFQQTANISIRNERERNRVKLLNLGFERLRAVVPCHAGEQLSKISTLKKAIWYIEHLDRVLHGQDERAPAEAMETITAPAAAPAPLTGSNGNSGHNQPVWTRDPRVRPTCQQTVGHGNAGGPGWSSAREAGSLKPGMTSWTPLALGPPANTQGVSSNPTAVKAMGSSVNRQRGTLSPVFPRQWDASNNEVQTPPKIGRLYKSQPRSSDYGDNSELMSSWSNVSPTGPGYVLPNANNGHAVLR